MKLAVRNHPVRVVLIVIAVVIVLLYLTTIAGTDSGNGGTGSKIPVTQTP